MWKKFVMNGVSLIVGFWVICVALALDTSQCTSPLGMESGELPDSDLSASTAFDSENVGPQNARVRVERQGGAWCPKNQITSEAEEWLQIELHTVHVITATETQGRFGNGQGAEYAEAYVISYWRPELNRWVRYRDHTGNEIVKGNINTYLAAKTELNPPIIASKIRILPYSYYRRTVCMRVEIYGCQFRGGLLSYSMPQGSKRGENWNFFDHTYDGVWEDNYLRNGLGQLTDGRNGPNNFKDDYYGHERGKGWVGWKSETKNGSAPVEIIFKFDSVREFSSLHIHASNQFTKEVQVFSEAKVYFSVGGKIFSKDPITYNFKEDCIFEDPKNITVKLYQRIGQFVKLELHWAAKWILISEVSFDSRPAMGNFTDEIETPLPPLVPPKGIPATPTIDQIPPKNYNNKQSPNKNEQGLAQSDFATDAFSRGKASSQGKISGGLVRGSNGGQEQSPPSSPVGPLSPPRMPPPTTVISEEWSSTAIVFTAVVSSFIAIVLVLLLILVALVFRHKLLSRGKMLPPGSESGGGGAHYDAAFHQNHHHHLEFGYVAPEDIRKAKSSGEYQEPFVDPQFSSFIVASNGKLSSSHHGGGGGSSTNGNGGSGSNSQNGSAGKMTEYYSCTLVSNPLAGIGQPGVNFGAGQESCNEYEYAVPNELGKLLPGNQLSPMKKCLLPSSSPALLAVGGRMVNNIGSGVNLTLRFRELGVPEIPKRNLRMLRKLGDGAFGTVFIGELEGSLGKGERNLVAVKHLLRNATDKDKSEFLEEVRLLSSIDDSNVTQVLGVCSESEPYSVVLEFLELGDLCQFLKQNDTLRSGTNRKLSPSSLIYIASQVASGMKFLECRNIVHRDLATRNCVVGRGLLVKISHFATDTDQYHDDYYKLDGKMPLPIRWMAWESLFLGKYSTKSDVWSFGVTLWEIMSLCRNSPYSVMNNQEVLHNLRRLSIQDESDPFEALPRPHACPRDVYQLMCDTWRRDEEDRPSFREIHSILMRKGVGVSSQNAPCTSSSAASSFIEHYIV